MNNNSTGPRTESGKARSSKNATKDGLFTTHDFILESETGEYTETLTDLWRHLKPEGVLEETFTTEIMTATWRLRRCRLVEAALATRELPPEDVSSEQKSVDRARAQSHGILRRSLSELRKLQTERTIRLEIGGEDLPGLVDSKQLMNAIRICDEHHIRQAKAKAQTEANPDSILDQLAKADQALGMKTPFGSSFCNPTLANPRQTPRNAECPCGSGEKFKRCCGKDAPPVLNTAA